MQFCGYCLILHLQKATINHIMRPLKHESPPLQMENPTLPCCGHAYGSRAGTSHRYLPGISLQPVALSRPRNRSWDRISDGSQSTGHGPSSRTDHRPLWRAFLHPECGSRHLSAVIFRSMVMGPCLPAQIRFPGFNAHSVGRTCSGHQPQRIFAIYEPLFRCDPPGGVCQRPQMDAPRKQKTALANWVVAFHPDYGAGAFVGASNEKGSVYRYSGSPSALQPSRRKGVNFYYQYTLYPAEVLKPLDRKLLKTCTLEAIPEGPFKNELRKNLTAHDWIEIESLENVDLVLTCSGSELLLKNGSCMVLKIPKKDFLAHPGAHLKRFSSAADRHVFFRQFTFYSLLAGFPITLYIFLYSLLFLMLSRWIKPGIASLASASLCFSAGLLMLIPLWQINAQEIVNKKLNPAPMLSNGQKEKDL